MRSTNTGESASTIDKKYLDSLKKFVATKFQQCKTANIAAINKTTFGNLHIAIPFELSQINYFYSGPVNNTARNAYISFINQYNLAYLQILAAVDGDPAEIAKLDNFFKPQAMITNAGVDPMLLSDMARRGDFVWGLLGYLMLDIVFSKDENIPVAARVNAIKLIKTLPDRIKLKKNIEQDQVNVFLPTVITDKGVEVKVEMLESAAAEKRVADLINKTGTPAEQQENLQTAMRMDSRNTTKLLLLSLTPPSNPWDCIADGFSEFSKGHEAFDYVHAQYEFVPFNFASDAEKASKETIGLYTNSIIKDIFQIKEEMHETPDERVGVKPTIVRTHQLEQGIGVLINKYPQDAAHVILGLLKSNLYSYPIDVDKSVIVNLILKLVINYNNAEQVLGVKASYRKKDYICPQELRDWAVAKTQISDIESYMDLKLLVALPDTETREALLELVQKSYLLQAKVNLLTSGVAEVLAEGSETNSYHKADINGYENRHANGHTNGFKVTA